jgi:hypothetical protein
MAEKRVREIKKGDVYFNKQVNGGYITKITFSEKVDIQGRMHVLKLRISWYNLRKAFLQSDVVGFNIPFDVNIERGLTLVRRDGLWKIRGQHISPMGTSRLITFDQE